MIILPAELPARAIAQDIMRDYHDEGYIRIDEAALQVIIAAALRSDREATIEACAAVADAEVAAVNRAEQWGEVSWVEARSARITARAIAEAIRSLKEEGKR